MPETYEKIEEAKKRLIKAMEAHVEDFFHGFKGERRFAYQFVYDYQERFGFVIWPWGRKCCEKDKIIALRIHVGTLEGPKWEKKARYGWPIASIVSGHSTSEFVIAMQIAQAIGADLEKEELE